MEELRSLISYGEKIQVGADGIDNKLIPCQIWACRARSGKKIS